VFGNLPKTIKMIALKSAIKIIHKKLLYPINIPKANASKINTIGLLKYLTPPDINLVIPI
jgi:hypothetical protein